MRVKSRLSTVLIVMVALVILSCAVYWGINRLSYKKIDNNTKDGIAAVVKRFNGVIPILEADGTMTNWVGDARVGHRRLMDKVLDNLTVVGKSRCGKPSKYIIATYFDTMAQKDIMKVYIPYNIIMPYKKVVIEVGDEYYVATADKDAVNAIVNYMVKQSMISKKYIKR